MTKRIIFISLVFFIYSGSFFNVPSCLAAFKEGEPDETLFFMSQAEFKISYTGEIHTHNLSLPEPHTLNFFIHHLSPNLERKEFSRGQEILINDGSNVWKYLPKQQLLIKRLSPDLRRNIRLIKRNISLVKQNYHINVSAGEVLLGDRKTLLLEFFPKLKESRPSRRVWIDSEKGIPLRTEIYSLDDRLAFLSFFNSINFREQPPLDLFILKVPANTSLRSITEREFDRMEQAHRYLPFKILYPSYLPQEFMLSTIKIKNGKEGEVLMEYSDGLSVVSLFQQTGKTSAHKVFTPSQRVEIAGQWGNLYHFGLVNLLEWKKEGLWLTLVGEINEREMIKLANSMDLQGGEK